MEAEKYTYGYPKPVHDLAEVYLERDVLANQSYLVGELFQNFLIEEMDIENIFDNPGDNASIEELEQWLDERDLEYQPMSPISNIDVEDLDDEEYKEELLELCLQEAEPAEVYEWWLVTDWLAENLKDMGQPVLEAFNSTWWGRCCTGQAIILDGTLQRIAEKFV